MHEESDINLIDLGSSIVSHMNGKHIKLVPIHVSVE